MNVNRIDGSVGKHIAVVVLLLVAVCLESICSGEIPAQRLTRWQGNVGVGGDIPRVTNVFTTLLPGATLAQINNAIATCPSNRVVQLEAGTYNLGTGQIFFNGKDGVVLRGRGKSTVLVFNGSPYQANILVQGPNHPWVEGTPPQYIVNWTGGYAQGATNLTLSSVNNLSVGTVLWLDQVNDNNDVGFLNSYEGCSNCGRSPGNRSQQHVAKVRAINGNVVTIWPPLHMPNWRSTQSPQAWWVGRVAERCGIENLAINGTASSPDSGYGANIAFYWTWDCWVRNVTSTNEYGSGTASSHVFLWDSGSATVRDCYFYGTRAAASMSYGVLLMQSHQCLVENNIFQKVASPVVLGAACSGNVVSYNYTTNNFYVAPATYLMSSFLPHDAHNCMNLFEGNHGNQVRADAFHGSSGYNTIFRNCLTGWDEPSRVNNNFSIMLDCFSRWWTVAGNLLGTPGQFTVLDSLAGYDPKVGKSIYWVGWSSGASVPNDPTTASTMYRDGNYDTVTRSVIWNPSNTTHTLPVSLYLPNKPMWFGDRPWPPFDLQNPSRTSPTNIPAGYRFAFGVDPPTGPVNQAPVAIANATPRSGNAPLLVQFSSSGSSDPEGATLTYSWTFGDGATSTAANPARTYSVDGSYIATLTVSDGTNNASANINIVVGNQPPTAVANATPTGGPAPLTVNFSSAGSSDPEGQPLSYTWTFGNGGSSTLANPSHTYQTPGIYTARVVVSDGVRSTTSDDLRISVGSGSGLPGLVAAYSFNEGSGTIVSDVSGNDNRGTVTGATWTTNGHSGGALVFDGSSSVVTINPSPSLTFSGGITLEAWVNPTALNGWRVVLYRGVDSFALEGSTPNGTPSFGGTFSPSPMYGTLPLALNTWSHLAGTYDGATMRLYVNGVQVASRVQAGAIQNSSQPVTIGGDAGYSQWWSGRIDEARIYNRALTASEIATVMQTPVDSATPPAIPQDFRILGE